MAEIALYVPQKRYVTVEYTDPTVEEGLVPIQVRMRSDLTVRESDALAIEKDDKRLTPDIWELVAPYVIDWNVGDEEGNKAPPPAEGGGQQFDLIPNGIFWRIYDDLRRKSVGLLDAKRIAPDSSKPSNDTAGNAGAGSTKAKRSNAKAS